MAIDDAERTAIIQAVRAYIAKERISREEFALRARLGKSTVDKLVVGIFSEKTILQLEAQLGLSLRGGPQPVEAAANFTSASETVFVSAVRFTRNREAIIGSH